MSTPETDFPKQLKADLIESLQPDCRNCIDARMLVCDLVKVAEVDSDWDVEKFSQIMQACTEGVKMEGACGTERKVCQHPDKGEFAEIAQEPGQYLNV